MLDDEGGAATPVTRADFTTLLSGISLLEGKFSSLKRELVEEQEAANERLAKRMKLDKGPT